MRTTVSKVWIEEAACAPAAWEVGSFIRIDLSDDHHFRFVLPKDPRKLVETLRELAELIDACMKVKP